jgi:hypothetical protein
MKFVLILGIGIMSGKKVLIYGGKGGLGTVLVSHFKSKGWWVCSIDMVRTF